MRSAREFRETFLVDRKEKREFGRVSGEGNIGRQVNRDLRVDMVSMATGGAVIEPCRHSA
jgi:hypothetical protein